VVNVVVQHDEDWILSLNPYVEKRTRDARSCVVNLGKRQRSVKVVRECHFAGQVRCLLGQDMCNGSFQCRRGKDVLQLGLRIEGAAATAETPGSANAALCDGQQ
jgi:hypothetical protein